MYTSNSNFTLPTHMQYFSHLIIDHTFFMQSVFVVITMLENSYCTKLSDKVTNSLENVLISSWLHTLPCGGPFVFIGGGVLLWFAGELCPDRPVPVWFCSWSIGESRRLPCIVSYVWGGDKFCDGNPALDILLQLFTRILSSKENV